MNYVNVFSIAPLEQIKVFPKGLKNAHYDDSRYFKTGINVYATIADYNSSLLISLPQKTTATLTNFTVLQ